MSEGEVVPGGWHPQLPLPHPVRDVCNHEIDKSTMPIWDPRVGKLWVCKKCGVRVYEAKMHHAAVGKKVHMSKKDRLRQRKDNV
jgi:hypothetical protein